ncbi:acetyl-CoA acetyltransferase, cytosolic isoform X1 [Daphnia magna]|uniref:Acetyl-CoA acetyltransferase, cytosolic n=1 Tax=Daphnia magna TaxID=35525 RepID=A0A0P5X9K7_9CRUS|nr:acetyl-CoA acetyltransferase, cytosolic isoform X1 [Daphnia magna]KZS12505.1 Acetyl-CoA acetyltransferase, cytosolic [Daphnia magna]
MKPADVYIVSATRTPIGSFCGKLSSFRGSELGSIVIQDALKRCSINPEDVSEVIMGQILTALEGQNPARQAACNAGIPYSVPAYTVNMLCGSGLKAVMLAAQSIQLGSSSVVVCGGQESMSRVPHAILMRPGIKMGNGTLNDTMIHDGLTDAFNHYHMGVTAENIAKQYQISRQQQDEYAVQSQQRTEEAKKANRYQAEIVPVTVKDRKGDIIVKDDEFPRPDTSLASLSKLRPAFAAQDGTVTAGNSSGLNDGAAALVLVSASEMEKRSLKPLARVVSYSQIGLDPSVMGLGPVQAVREAVAKAEWTLDSVDLFELNEAFAAQAVSVIHQLGIDPNKSNVNGGAIALGHPVGASGARVLVSLVHSMVDRQAQRGVAALCVGGGMGVAMCIERC